MHSYWMSQLQYICIPRFLENNRAMHFSVGLYYLYTYWFIIPFQINIIWTLWKEWWCLTDTWWWTNYVRTPGSFIFLLLRKRQKSSIFFCSKSQYCRLNFPSQSKNFSSQSKFILNCYALQTSKWDSNCWQTFYITCVYHFDLICIFNEI